MSKLNLCFLPFTSGVIFTDFLATGRVENSQIGVFLYNAWQ
ncbi:hypothetical protein ACSLVK_15420 [Photorhabdus tasmaniensis]